MGRVSGIFREVDSGAAKRRIESPLKLGFEEGDRSDQFMKVFNPDPCWGIGVSFVVQCSDSLILAKCYLSEYSFHYSACKGPV